MVFSSKAAVLSAMLFIGGLTSIGRAMIGGRSSERVLGVTLGVSQVVFGILALAWSPDGSRLAASSNSSRSPAH